MSFATSIACQVAEEFPPGRSRVLLLKGEFPQKSDKSVISDGRLFHVHVEWFMSFLECRMFIGGSQGSSANRQPVRVY